MIKEKQSLDFAVQQWSWGRTASGTLKCRDLLQSEVKWAFLLLEGKFKVERKTEQDRVWRSGQHLSLRGAEQTTSVGRDKSGHFQDVGSATRQTTDSKATLILIPLPRIRITV